MPTVKRPGKRAIYCEVEQELAEALESLAGKNERTVRGELTIALRSHLEAAGAWPPKGRKADSASAK